MPNFRKQELPGQMPGQNPAQPMAGGVQGMMGLSMQQQGMQGMQGMPQQRADASMPSSVPQETSGGHMPGDVGMGEEMSAPKPEPLQGQMDSFGDGMQDEPDERVSGVMNQPEQQPGGGPMNGINEMPSLLQAKAIGEQQIIEAEMVLMKYKAGKHRLQRRIIHDQQWWKLRNWQEIEGNNLAHGSGMMKTNTAWLWNCVVGKHADFIDAFPEPIVLPRAEDDKQEAQRLSEVVPVILEQNDFEQVYNDCQWQKLTEGTACYGVFWDKDKLNGLGDVAISKINLLNMFWEPGITNLQDSRHLFLCELQDNDLLEQMYPELAGEVKNTKVTLASYIYDDTVDVTDKSVVVDWYYHKYSNGKKLLHYVKFVGHHVLYATENEQDMKDRGLYDDGMFPFVLDPLYPVEGSPCGIGLIDVGQGAQTDIDVMSQAMVRNAAMSSTPRFFIRKDGSVNEEEFADWTKPMIHVSGNLGQDTIQPVQIGVMNGGAQQFLQQKIEELKFVTGNVDINNGGTPSGVTAASAIAALKQDAGRTSKDSNKSAYRAYRQLVTMVIERIRQFYDMPRQYRIVGQRGEENFAQYDNSGLQVQPQQNAFGEDMGMRLPVFDIMVRAQRENAYTKTAQNELAIQFYQLGFFNPMQADMTLMALDMMDFRGKEDIVKKVQQGQTMQQMIQQLVQLSMAIAQQNGDANAMAAIQQVVSGGDPSAAGMAPAQGMPEANVQEGDNMGSGLQQQQKVPAQKQMDRMQERMSKAKVPD